MKLFSIREEFWDKVQPSYAASDWLPYRAPTGITSSSRDHVEKWIKSISDCNPDDLIEENIVPCSELLDILSELETPASIDVLQIDTEGTDELVLSACNIDVIPPRLILIETSHLGKERLNDLTAGLKAKGYLPAIGDINSLFIRERID